MLARHAKSRVVFQPQHGAQRLWRERSEEDRQTDPKGKGQLASRAAGALSAVLYLSMRHATCDMRYVCDEESDPRVSRMRKMAS